MATLAFGNGIPVDKYWAMDKSTKCHERCDEYHENRVGNQAQDRKGLMRMGFFQLLSCILRQFYGVPRILVIQRFAM
jgi:hypothetical protein